jgi:AsmA protein
MKKDIIEGAATGTISLSMSGDTAALIKKTLNGKGEVSLKDGAIVGIDIPGMINNLKTAFGTAQAAETTERTDFSEFIIPFDIKDGIITTQNTSLVSPALRVKAKGNADLTKDSLDFRIEPTFVKTLKGQGDTKERSGITVPVLVTGTFTEPKFSPDLSGLAEKALEKGIEKGVEKLLKDKTGNDEKSDSKKDAVKGLLKGLLGK